MTTLVINPGSGAIPAAGDGWTNTVEGARVEAQHWLTLIRDAGIQDVEMHPQERATDDGRWQFGFCHTITGKYVVLETHGIDNLAAYEKERIFPPRVYWNGSSSADLDITDWLLPGSEVVTTIRQVTA